MFDIVPRTIELKVWYGIAKSVKVFLQVKEMIFFRFENFS